ncbi:Pyridoxamine 5-phosphate oxidase [Mycena indigotica]|uniref:pyridoxal 5'-phosphate synthase n=1 Tax=Mycena indigotica TaxID=2126181 RepID=A0A8H6SHA0_9AGAR|nr:Pyridoxamine 5-phosphate oxidase [Mycena indigotica]KAF7298867.1 Pyridoxamine 5-phosphate oxidase [Mycena indigotica]
MRLGRSIHRFFQIRSPLFNIPRLSLWTPVLPHTQYNDVQHLTPSTVQPSPLDQFRTWFAAAAAANVHEPEAMSLSTCTPDGLPSARIVLFKQIDARGFVFFTNYTSRKSAELLANPNAALVFYWREVSRQVRITGRVEKVSKEESEQYFNGRPLGSRLGAWASPQSSVVTEDEVQKRLEEVKARFGDANDIPLPDFWGGWRVIPSQVEFWSGKPSRLHDRVLYTRQTDGEDVWTIDRLAP